MASADLVLQFIYPPESANADMRTFQVNQIPDGSAEPVEVYRVRYRSSHLTLARSFQLIPETSFITLTQAPTLELRRCSARTLLLSDGKTLVKSNGSQNTM